MTRKEDKEIDVKELEKLYEEMELNEKSPS
jgi:hypothetical protein